MFRHWDEWRVGVRHHVFVADASGAMNRCDVTPGDFDSPPHFYEDGGIAFSPDGKELAFVSNREGGDREAWTTNNDVWIVPVAGGEAKEADDRQPRGGRDAGVLAGRQVGRRPRAAAAGFESDRWYIDIYDRRLARSGRCSRRRISRSANTRSHRTARRSGSPPRRRDRQPFVVSFRAAARPADRRERGRDQLAARRATSSFRSRRLTSPSGRLRAGRRRQRLHAAADARERLVVEGGRLADAGEPDGAGAGGTPFSTGCSSRRRSIASKKYPVVFLIHGGPQGAWEDAWSSRWNPSLWAAQGWVVAAPNPRGSTGFGQTFVDEISQDWGGKVMTDLEAVFDAVAGMPFVDSGRMASPARATAATP